MLFYLRFRTSFACNTVITDSFYFCPFSLSAYAHVYARAIHILQVSRLFSVQFLKANHAFFLHKIWFVVGIFEFFIKFRFTVACFLSFFFRDSLA